MEDTFPGKQIHNVLGHYTRWDVLSLNFNPDRLSPFTGTLSQQDTSTTKSMELEEMRQHINEINEKLDKLTEQLKQ